MYLEEFLATRNQKLISYNPSSSSNSNRVLYVPIASNFILFLICSTFIEISDSVTQPRHSPEKMVGLGLTYVPPSLLLTCR